MSKDFRYVGKAFPSDDALRKVTGGLLYGNDMVLPGMLYAKLLLSTTAHGLVKRIDTGRAEKVPGVVGVFTCFNTPDTKFSRYNWLKSCPKDESLFSRQVRFAGDRVAAVVAGSLATAALAASLIEVEYEELPALLTPDDALGSGAARIHPAGNLADEYAVALGEECPGEWLTVESETRTQNIHHAAIEPHVCLADYDGKLTVWSPTQGIFGVRNMLADFLGLGRNDVRVVKLPIGGSFGGKQEFIIEPLTAFLAYVSRRPVKLLLDREQCIIATTARPATTTRIRTTVTGDGYLRTFAADSTLDAGAYIGSSIDYAHSLTKKVTRLYRVPAYRHSCRVVYTNKVVAGGARGWGGPEINTATEIHMDKVARAVGCDPVELRLKNLVHPHDFDPAFRLSLGDARVIECLEKGAQEFNWREKYQAPPGRGRWRRGVGVACGAHKNGFFDASYPDFSTTILRMNEDGSVILSGTVHDVGCGVETTMRIIVAEVLGIDPDLVVIAPADTAYTPYDAGCYGSRSTYVVGACVCQAAEKLKDRLLEWAAFLLQKPKESLRATDGRVEGDSGESLSYRGIATGVILDNHGDLMVTHTYNVASNPGAYSVQFAEVEVDTLTGLTRVTDFLAVCDIGRTINRAMVEGQFQGAVQMGIGYALCEEIAVNEKGRPVNNSFKKYNLVNAPDMPDVKVLLIEHEGDFGPFGAKSIGEISTAPTAGAVINAVNHALDTSLSDLPLTSEKILAALKHGGDNCAD